MQKLIKNSILQIIICTLITVTAFAQAPRSVAVTLPSTVGACLDNSFTASFNNSQNAIVKIATSLDVSTFNCSAISPIRIAVTNTTGGISDTSLNATGDTLTFNINTASAESITYHVYVDCSVIDTSGAISNITLKQVLTDTTNTYSFNVNTSGTNYLENQNIGLPVITELNPVQDFYARNLTDTYLTFYYKNNGSAPANMAFNFTPDANDYCNQINTLGFDYRNTATSNFTTFNPANSITTTLQPFDTLIIRQRINKDTCLSNCNNATAAFIWRCNLSLGSGVFCNNCQEVAYNHSYKIFNEDDAQLKIQRLSPITQAIDTTCSSDINDMLFYHYRFTNSGKGAIDTISFNLKQQGSLGNEFHYLSLINTDSLKITSTCGSCVQVNTIDRNQYLCSAAIPNALQQASFLITDFLETDTLEISFYTYKCIENNDTLINTTKRFGKWQFANMVIKDICGDGTPSDLIAAAPNTLYGPFGISQLDNNSNSYDIHQQLAFYPTVTDLTVPKDSTFGESATFEIELNSLINNQAPFDYQLLGCPNGPLNCNLRGYLRATIALDSNLHIQNRYTDVKLKLLNKQTNLFDSIAPVYFYSVMDTSLCRKGSYYYYYDLSISQMRNYLDSGKFEFIIQSCCVSDKSPSVYDVTFHLLPNPDNCFTINFPSVSHDTIPICSGSCDWLPLSRRGSTLSAHCPGCKFCGVIADKYRMERKSFGLQDSNDNNRADDGAIQITDTSAWFNQYENLLKKNFSSYGDEIEDYLTAHLEPGDPSTGGYSYQDMQLIGADLPVLHLQRTLNNAFDSIGLNVLEFWLYIDKPVTSNADCRDCNLFETDTTKWRTEKILNVSGNDIFTNFLDTGRAAGLFLYRFTSYYDRIANSYNGNLHSPFVTYDDATNPWTGFYEGQQYRLRVRYTKCGNWLPQGEFTADDIMIEGEILNRMYLTGTIHDKSNTFTFTQAANTVSILNSSGFTFDTIAQPQLDLLDSSYTNNRQFYCETNGGRHFFFSQYGYNVSELKNGSGCTKVLTVKAQSVTAGYNKQYANIYPYEYRVPSFLPDSFMINVPSGYELTGGRIYHQLYLNNNTPQTGYNYFNIGPLTGTVTINNSSLPQGRCLLESSVFPFTSDTLFYGDQFTQRNIEFIFTPIQCTDTNYFYPDTNLIVIAYGNSTVTCGANASCDNSSDLLDLVNRPQPIFVLPNLKTQFSSLLEAKRNIVCDTLVKITNKAKQIIFSNYGNNTPYLTTDADNVYLSVPTNLSYLTNWYFLKNGTTTAIPAVNGIIPLDTLLIRDTEINGRLCASYTECRLPNTTSYYEIYAGWNCDTFPAAPFNVNAVCNVDSTTVGIRDAASELFTTGKTYTRSQYTICDTVGISACYRNTQIGGVYPLSLQLTPQFNGMTIPEVYMIFNGDSTLLTPSGNGSLWNITGTDLAAIGIADSALVDGDLCFFVVAEPGCDFPPTNALPDLILNAVNFCDSSLNVPAFFNGSFTYSGNTVCTDCFSVTKTANTGAFLAVTDTVIYTIQVCNNSVGTLALTISDSPPTFFNQISTTLPSSSINLATGACNTYTLTGTFSQIGSCDSNYNHVMVTNDTTNTQETDSVCIIVVQDLCSAGADIIIPDSSFSSSYGSGISNSTVYIDGRFYINQAFTFTNCMVYVKSGGQIIVSSNYEDPFVLDSSHVIGCNSMWRGIYLNQSNFLNFGGAVHLINGSSVRDANEAIFANDNCYVFSRNSSLHNNVKGIVVPQKNNGNLINNTTLNIQSTEIGMTAAAFKPNYLNQPAHGAIPTSGVELNDWFGTLGDTMRNDFFNMVNGITGFRSQFTSRNNYFENIRLDTTLTGKPPVGSGYAIENKGTVSLRPGNLTVLKSTSTPETITNCHGGVYTNYSSLTASNLKMSVTNTAISVTQCKNGLFTSVTGDSIQTNLRALYLWLNAGASLMDASANTIVVQNHASGTGIYLFENTAGFANYKVQYNQITLNAANTGIHSNGAFKALITDNHVFQNYSTGTIETKGISVTGGDSVTLSCNTMITDYAQTIFKVYGIYFSGSKAYNISCNNSYNHYYGNYFVGKCNNSDENFKGNTMNNNRIGLYLWNNAEIGVQTLRGNLFINYLGANGAINNNTSNLFASTFFANLNSQEYPNPSPANWFFSLSGNIYSCGFNCNSALVAGGGNNNDERIVALNMPTSTEFIDENKSMSKSNLFEELSDNVALRNSEQLFTDFYNNNINNSIGKQYSINEKINDAISYSPASIGLIAIADSIINEKKDSLEIVGNDPSIPNYDVLKSSLLTSISIIAQTRNNIVQQEIGNSDILLNDASQIIATVTPQELPEENNKFASEINILYEKFGIDALLPFYNQILSIAQQCPAAGGNAVYTMRGFVDYFDAPITYNDDAICLQFGFYRQQSPVVKNSIDKVKIVPNPASTKIDIYLTNLAEGFCTLEISNYLGQKVYQTNLDCKQMIHSVNISNFTQGIYSVKIKMPYSKIELIKLIVTK